MATRKLYALILTGQGDTDIRLVEKDVWDWVMGAKPKQKIPAPILAKLREHHERDGFGEFEPPYLTTGSAINDAALSAPPAMVDGEEASFDSVNDLLRFARKHDIEIEEEFEGCIY